MASRRHCHVLYHTVLGVTTVAGIGVGIGKVQALTPIAGSKGI